MDKSHEELIERLEFELGEIADIYPELDVPELASIVIRLHEHRRDLRLIHIMSGEGNHD